MDKQKISSDAKIEIGIDTTTYPPHHAWFIHDDGRQFTSLPKGRQTREECIKDLLEFCDHVMEDGTDKITVTIEFR